MTMNNNNSAHGNVAVKGIMPLWRFAKQEVGVGLVAVAGTVTNSVLGLLVEDSVQKGVFCAGAFIAAGVAVWSASKVIRKLGAPAFVP